jgi:hypothetical protein
MERRYWTRCSSGGHGQMKKTHNETKNLKKTDINLTVYEY